MTTSLRLAFRGMRRQPSYSALAILSMTVGILLTVIAFTLVDGVLFRPLPYRDPGRLYALFGAVRSEGDSHISLSPSGFETYRTAEALESAAAFRSAHSEPARITGAEENVLATVAAVSSEFFRVLGVAPLLGREFDAADFRNKQPSVALVTHALWRRAFGASPDALGRVIRRGGESMTIVGVLPRDFVFPLASTRLAPEVIVPLVFGSGDAPDPDARSLYVIARLAETAVPQQAQTELDAMARRHAIAAPVPPNVRPGPFDGITMVPLREELTRGSSSLTRLLFLATCLVLLVACANVAVMMLARGAGRQREFAVRAALGAGRAELIRLVVAEAVAITAIATALAAVALHDALAAVAARVPDWLQLVGEPSVRWRTFAFAVTAAAAAAVLASVLPAATASRGAGTAATELRGSTSTGRRSWLNWLIAIEMALATVLIVGGMLMINSAARLFSLDPGFNAENVIALRVAPSNPSHRAARRAFDARLSAALGSVPRVMDVALTDAGFLQRLSHGSRFIAPRAASADQAGLPNDVTVTPNYFRVVGIPLLRGRWLTPADADRAVVISETLARRYWPGENPVGRVIRYGDGTRAIAGVVGDVRDLTLDGAPTATLYHAWSSASTARFFMVRTAEGRAPTLVTALRRRVRSVDDRAVVTIAARLGDLAATSVAERTFNTIMLTAFGASGLLLAAVGLFSLISYSVSTLERDIGIRLAIGAAHRHIISAVASHTLAAAAAGAGAGVMSAYVASGSMRTLVFGIAPDDPVSYAAAVAILGIAAAFALILPLRKAFRVDPLTALRAE